MALFDEVAVVKPGKKLPWDRMNREKPEHFEAFQHYLASTVRSLPDTAEKCQLQVPFVQSLAKTYNWLARANAYDSHSLIMPDEAEIIPSEVSTIKEMTNAHVAMARKAQKVAITALHVLDKYMADYEFARQAGQDLPARPYLKPEEIVKIGKFGVDLERLSLGEATSRTESKSIDYSSLSDEELKMLQSLLDKAEPESSDE